MPHNRHVCGVRSIVLVILGVQGLAIGVEASQPSIEQNWSVQLLGVFMVFEYTLDALSPSNRAVDLC
jgi:hypothetical protein